MMHFIDWLLSTLLGLGGWLEMAVWVDILITCGILAISIFVGLSICRSDEEQKQRETDIDELIKEHWNKG